MAAFFSPLGKVKIKLACASLVNRPSTTLNHCVPMYLYQLLKGSVLLEMSKLENKFLSLDFCTNDKRRKREFF